MITRVVQGGGMFGQDNDQQQTQDDQSFFSTPLGGDFGAATTPAPGAPAGPINHEDVPTHDEQPAEEISSQLDYTNALTGAQSVPVTTPVSNAPAADDLLNIKQDALHELSPLVDHLEQSPEEKFRTTMMMIQASDDHSLIRPAYDAAKQITDEKARAQALLDVVNEINYFTQQHQS